MRPLDDPVFLAWVAGFFDGEGTICIQKLRDKRGSGLRMRFYLHCMIYQTERAPLDEIRRTFGGSISKLKTRVYSLHITSARARQFLSAIRPYVRVKGAEADIALAFSATFTGTGRERLTIATVDMREAFRDDLMRYRARKYGRESA